VQKKVWLRSKKRSRTPPPEFSVEPSDSFLGGLGSPGGVVLANYLGVFKGLKGSLSPAARARRQYRSARRAATA
jgi:hypothetical protein